MLEMFWSVYQQSQFFLDPKLLIFSERRQIKKTRVFQFNLIALKHDLPGDLAMFEKNAAFAYV